jgi:16S rRNA (adenine1518-N6/adenine1519-N6)-dimethyltransferase
MSRCRPHSRPKLGQHFLIDPAVVSQIVSAAALPATAIVVEIGPGEGVLTRALSAAVPGGQVLAIEVDGTLAHQLRERVSKRVKVIHADALRFDYVSVANPYHVVSNLPYQITSPILHRLIGAANPPESMTLMVQREVADRLLAQPKTRQRGLLTVVAEWYGSIERCFDVSPEAFRPPPAVWSTVVRLTSPHLLGRTRGVEPRKPPFRAFVNFLKVGFSQKRRQLHHPLGASFPILKPELDAIYESGGIERTMRAEELTFEQWVRLFNECSHRLTAS